MVADRDEPASKRVIIKRLPALYEWKGPFEGWARNWVHANFWRVREVLGSEEDALQECALVFVRCVKRYGTMVDNPAWMMSLFKRAVANEWHTYSLTDSGMRSLEINDEEQVDHNTGYLLAAITGASAEAQQVIQVVLSAPTEFLDILLGNGKADSDAMLNRRFRRLLKWKSNVDVVKELRALLS